MGIVPSCISPLSTAPKFFSDCIFLCLFLFFLFFITLWTSNLSFWRFNLFYKKCNEVTIAICAKVKGILKNLTTSSGLSISSDGTSVRLIKPKTFCSIQSKSTLCSFSKKSRCSGTSFVSECGEYRHTK